MKNLVSTAKKLLIKRVTEMYTYRRSDLDTFEYADHYKELGKIIARIDEYNYLSTIINDIERGEYDHVGISGDDEDILSFGQEIYQSV